MQYANFSEVKGYSTYLRALRRGGEIAQSHAAYIARWVVIALPNSRFAPMVIINQTVQGGPCPFLNLTNVCLCN